MSKLQASTEAEIRFVARMATEFVRAARSLQFVDASPGLISFATNHGKAAEAALAGAVADLSFDERANLIKMALDKAYGEINDVATSGQIRRESGGDAIADKARRFADRIAKLKNIVARENAQMTETSRGNETPGVLSSGPIKRNVLPSALPPALARAYFNFHDRRGVPGHLKDELMKTQGEIQMAMPGMLASNKENGQYNQLVRRELAAAIRDLSQFMDDETTNASLPPGNHLSNARMLWDRIKDKSNRRRTIAVDLENHQQYYAWLKRNWDATKAQIEMQEAPGVLSTDEFKGQPGDLTLPLVRGAKQAAETVKIGLANIIMSISRKENPRLYNDFEIFMRGIDDSIVRVRNIASEIGSNAFNQRDADYNNDIKALTSNMAQIEARMLGLLNVISKYGDREIIQKVEELRSAITQARRRLTGIRTGWTAPGVLSTDEFNKQDKTMKSAFLFTKTGVYLSRDAVEALCPSCAKSMKSRRLRGIRLTNVKGQMLAEIKQKLGTADPGFFGRCLDHDFGHSFSDKESFCAWLHHRVTGHWPGED